MTSTARPDRDPQPDRYDPRAMWQRFEPFHAVVYFAPEVHERLQDAGLRGFWMGYFASRAYPLGPASPAVVTALFFNFHPAMVARALPDAWRFADLDAIAAARLSGVDAALRRILGDTVDRPEVAKAADLAEAAARACPVEGRALFAAYSALPWPAAPHLRLWHAATLLREHRGDGHVVANVAHGVDGLEAHLLSVATTDVERATVQPYRGWSDDDWDAARARLEERRWLAGDRVTDRGRAVRDGVETLTDDLARAPWAALGADGTARLASLLEPLARRVVETGAIPVPNPMGVPWPPR